MFIKQVETKPRAAESPVKNESEKKEMAKSFHTEFGGAFGTFLMMFFLPGVLYYINMACAKVI